MHRRISYSLISRWMSSTTRMCGRCQKERSCGLSFLMRPTTLCQPRCQNESQKIQDCKIWLDFMVALVRLYGPGADAYLV